MKDNIEKVYEAFNTEYSPSKICNFVLGDLANAMIPSTLSDQVDNCVLCKSIVNNMQLKIFAEQIQGKTWAVAEKLCSTVAEDFKENCVQIFDGVITGELASMLYLEAVKICAHQGLCKA